MSSHVSHGRDIPAGDVAVEGGGGDEHAVHVSHGRDVPAGDVAVEGGGAGEHPVHVSHGRDVPAGEIAVEGGGDVNIQFMLVTAETSQPEMSPLKEEAPLNVLSMLVTVETFQSERLPLKEEASRNMFCIEVTCDRSGASVALYSMPEAPQNAPLMEDHSMSPHWSMDASLDAVESVLPRIILERSPVIDTWYSPEARYVCDCVPFVVTGVMMPSPQSIVNVPSVRTSTGMLIVYGEAATFHVVTNASAGSVVSGGISILMIWTPSSSYAATAAYMWSPDVNVVMPCAR